jgi:diguanylate cyclase (GGDEF)-like protein
MNIYYAAALFVSTAISVAVALSAWHRRNAPGAVGLFILMLGIAIWSFTYAIRWCVVGQAAQIFWLNSTYLGVVIVPTAMLVMTLQFTNRSHLLTRRNLLLLILEPILTLLLLWTDSFHGLFFAGKQTTGTILSGGPWFYIHVLYSYVLLLLMVGVFAREYWHASHLYRNQTAVVLVGTLIPWVGNMISFSGLFPYHDLDITPFSFIASGLLFSFGMLHYRLMDIVPIAHGQLVTSMPDGMIVLDAYNRIVEINPAAQYMTGVGLSEIGKSAELALAHWPVLSDYYHVKLETQLDLQISLTLPRVIELRFIPLWDKRKRSSGMLIILHDITKHVQMEEQLRQMSIKDSLTGLYNRSFFEAEIARLERGRQFPVSLVMLDLDYLKLENDQQGHEAGDKLLKRTAQVLNATFRVDDIITRIGGDEFVVILPGTDAATAEVTMQRLSRVIDEHNAQQNERPLSLSAGCSTADKAMTLVETFKKADAAMYMDKRIRHERSHLAE